MTASIPWVQPALNFFLNRVFICYGCSQILELSHHFKMIYYQSLYCDFVLHLQRPHSSSVVQKLPPMLWHLYGLWPQSGHLVLHTNIHEAYYCDTQARSFWKTYSRCFVRYYEAHYVKRWFCGLDKALFTLIHHIYTVYTYNKALYTHISRSQWPHGLRRGSAAVRPLRLWDRIPPTAWIFVCCVLSGRGLYDGVIARPGSYRLWRVVVWSRNLKNEVAMARVGPQRHRKKRKYA